MNTKSMQVRLGVAFAAFIFLILLATVGIFRTADSQKTDGLVINTSGKLRMLSQKMAKEAFEVMKGLTDAGTLKKTMEEFTTSLNGLRTGDATIGLPATESRQIRNQLENADKLWDIYSAELNNIIVDGPKILDAETYLSEKHEELFEAVNAAYEAAEKADANEAESLIKGLMDPAHEMVMESLMVLEGLVDASDLKNNAEIFDENISALLYGKFGKDLDNGLKEKLLSEIRQIEKIWKGYKENVQNVIARGGSLNKSLGIIRDLNMPLLVELDKAVKMYETESESKIVTLKKVQVVFLIVALIITLIVTILIRKTIVTPLSEAVELAIRISEGIITGKLRTAPSAFSVFELDELIGALNTMSVNLRGLIGRVKESSNSVKLGSKKLSEQAETMRINTEVVNISAHDTSASITQMGRSVENIQRQTDTLSQSAESVSASIEEMSVSIRGVEAIAEKLTKVVEDSSSSIEQTSASILNVAKNAGDIAQSVEEEFDKMNSLYQGVASFTHRGNAIAASVDEVFTSMEELAASIREVASNSERAGQLSSQTSQDAHKGRQALNKAIKAMDSIRNFQDEAAKIIGTLSERADDIGNIITVIDEIAEQTNLLALNAAIEAARAGEHGRGFAVVAEEVRKLAERTSLATSEIAELIKGVQKESKVAVGTMKSGAVEVEKGVFLAENSSQALNTIIDGVDKTVSIVRNIAGSTQEQESASIQVTGAMSRVSEQAEEIKDETTKLEEDAAEVMNLTEKVKTASAQIAASTKEQSTTIEQISMSVMELSNVAKHVLTSSKEQTAAADQIVNAVNSISDQLYQIKTGTDEQASGVRNIVDLTRKLAAASDETKRNIDSGVNEIKTISEQAESLNHQIEDFRISDERSPKSIALSEELD